jgi:lipid A 4'-phosphatase
MKSGKKEIIIISLLLLAMTVVFYIIDLDIMLQNVFYDQSDGWYLARETPWNELRDYSSVPALLVSIFALGGIILGYNIRRYAPYRKIYLYLVVLMILGPGLIVNALLKDNFGRPRPRSITEYGGKYDYEAPLSYDASSPGKSFPCGHASMGFYFFGIYILFRKSRKYLARAGLYTAIIFGSLIGVARMLQGGHFFSDVIYSAALLYILALWLYHVFRFDRGLLVHLVETSSGKKRLVSLVASLAILLIMTAVLLATPRSKKTTIVFEADEYIWAREIRMNIELLAGEVELTSGEQLQVYWEFEGFGFPKSNIRYRLDTAEQDSVYTIDIGQYVKGYFTELDQIVEVSIPSGLNVIVKYSSGGEENILYNPER